MKEIVVKKWTKKISDFFNCLDNPSHLQIRADIKFSLTINHPSPFAKSHAFKVLLTHFG